MYWTDVDYEVLFRGHPPTESTAPTPAECGAIGQVLGCTRGGVAAQWADGRSLVLGQASAASRDLRDYLFQQGWLLGGPGAGR